jgi:MFS family permease
MADAKRSARIPPMAWAVWGLGAAFYCYGFFQRVAPSVMVGDLMTDFAVGGAILGNLSAFYFYAYAGLQLPVGLIIDRWGPRRVMTVAVLVTGVGSLLFALAGSLGPAYLGRLLVGAGAGFSWVGCLTLITAWFPARRFAMVTGLTLFVGLAGAIGGQAPLAALVTVAGWRATMLAAAAFAVLLALAIWLIVRDRPIGAAVPKVSAAGESRALWQGLHQVAGRRQTWVLALVGSMMAAPMLSLGALWGVPYLSAAHGLSRPAAALNTSLMLVGWAVGSPLVGWISDRIGRRRLPMTVGALIAVSSMTLLLVVPGLTLGAVRVLLFLNGFAGGTMVLCFAVMRETNAGGAIASGYGVVNMTVMAGGAIFQPLIGFLLDRMWDGRMEGGARLYSVAAYETAFMTLSAATAVGLLATLFVRETWCRPAVGLAPA